MTARSTRRAAEMAVIDAAYGFVYADPRANWQEYGALAGAVRDHKKLGLDATSQPAFSNNSTDTSAAAGASMRDLTGYMSHRVNDEIFVSWRRGALGLTCDQVEIALNGTHQSISARVNELRDKGWIVDSGQRRKTRSGRAAIVWTPSQAARERG